MLAQDHPQPQAAASMKKKRNLPGTPDPAAEVIALSPKTLMATNRFVCEICNKGFQRDQNLQLHRRGHNLPWKLRQRAAGEEARKRVYVCPEKGCVHNDPARALGDLTGIKKHFSRKHGEKKWKCERCSKKYAVQSDWKAHLKSCGSRQYKCDCGTIFSRKDSFITHRAFCDALTEESAKLSTAASDLLQPPQPAELDHPDWDQGKSRFPVVLERASTGSDNLYGSMVLPEYGAWPPVGRPEEGGSFASLYNDKAWQPQEQQHAHLSATALLQKASQMGATAGTALSIFAGFRAGAAPSSSSAESFSPLMSSGMVGVSEAFMTRDFLGIGPAGGNNVRSFLRQDMAGFGAVGSGMNGPFRVNH